MRRILLACLLASLTASAPLASAQSLAKAKLGLHAVPSGTAECGSFTQAGCADAGTSNLTTSVGLGTYDVYVVAVDIDPAAGLRGATFGLQYDGTAIAVNSFSLCFDLSFPSTSPDFPTESTSGVVVTTNVCINTPDPSDPEGEAMAVLGWLQVEATEIGVLALTPRLYLPSPDAQVADCAAAATNLDVPDDLGKVGFGTDGYDPCAEMTVPVEEKTWGRIKSMWAND